MHGKTMTRAKARRCSKNLETVGVRVRAAVSSVSVCLFKARYAPNPTSSLGRLHADLEYLILFAIHRFVIMIDQGKATLAQPVSIG